MSLNRLEVQFQQKEAGLIASPSANNQVCFSEAQVILLH